MSGLARLVDVRRAPSRRGAPRRGERGEDGFILLESIVAIGLIGVLMGALATFTLGAVTATAEMRARQGAAQLATSAMSTLGSLPASDLVTGRDSASVTAQVAAAPATVKPLVSTPATAQLSDPSAGAGAGAGAQVPTSPTTQTLNGVSYSVSTYLGSCRLRSATSTECVASGSGTPQLRAVVVVQWSNRACRSGACTYTSSTLVNATDDPVFNVNRTDVTSDPEIVDPGAQRSTRGREESLQLTVKNGTGLAPYTWQVSAGSLPTGLSLSGSGLVGGTPTVLGGPTSVTVVATDVFGRTDTASFTWTVVAPPTITTPAAQTSPQGRALSLATTSTCPNSPCTFSISGAPPGLSIDAATGTVSGTPTTVGTSSVTITVTDADGAAVSTTPFTWTVVNPLTVGSPGTLSTTVGRTVSVAVAYTCASGPCTISLAGTAPGVGLSPTTPVTASNAVTSLVVANGTGTVYLTGVVQAAAVPSGTSRVWTPTLTIAAGGTTATSAAGSWTVYARPTVAAPGTRSVTVGSTRNVGIDYTCPATPCTLTLTGAVPGLGLSATAGRATANATTSLTLTAPSGTVWIAGLVDAAAVPSGTSRAWPMTLTLTDASTVAVTSTGTWTATSAPKITDPGSQAAAPGQNLTLQLTAACPNGGCTWAASAQVGADPTLYPVAVSSTGRVTYAGVPAGTYTLRVQVTDADGISDTVAIPLVVQTFNLAMPNLTTARPLTTRTITVDVTQYMTPQADGITYTISGNPAWMTLSADGILTGTVGLFTASATNVTITATSTASSTSRDSHVFSWTIR